MLFIIGEKFFNNDIYSLKDNKGNSSRSWGYIRVSLILCAFHICGKIAEIRFLLEILKSHCGKRLLTGSYIHEILFVIKTIAKIALTIQIASANVQGTHLRRERNVYERSWWKRAMVVGKWELCAGKER